MKLNKTILGVTTALLGSFVLTGQVSASEWKQRTVDQVQQSFEEEDGNSSYTIQYGDTLGVISKAVGVEMTRIAKINGIEDLDVISTGDQLTFKKDEATGEVEEIVVEDATTQEEVVYEVEENEVTEEVTYEEPVAQEETTYEEPVQYTATGSEAEAKEWIAQHESGGDYYITNPSGKYIGKYQLDRSYLNGDHSPANQERVAEEYVAQRYGSWTQAKAHWQDKGWY